ncbi:MSCRAMM family protein [Parasphingorhabdus pacifica]
MRTFRRLATAVLGTAALAGGTLLAAPASALAAPQEGVGHETRPGQPYGGQERSRDWLGSYEVNGEQVWCVQFALTAPDSGEEYQPGDELRTKWGTPLPDDIAANISYLLLRHGNTTSPDEAAALAHLLHSWTAAPRDESDLDPANSFRTIGYDIDSHFEKLPQAAKEAVDRLRTDAEANRGPWTAALTAPEGEQTIDRTDEWTLTVERSDGHGVSDVPVNLRATDATIEGVGENGTVTTPADGSPLTLRVTPTGPEPSIDGELAAPAEHPYVRQAVNQPDTTQRVVSTGGEQQLAVNASTTAVTAPGAVRIAKIDAESEAAIAGVALRVTGTDGGPAVRQDGSPLVGADGEPAVVTTGDDGTATVPDLRTPQEIRITEVAPAPGYEEAFDPEQPPSVSGTVTPGSTLALSLLNEANTPTVPIEIPAGDPSFRGETVQLGVTGDHGLTAAAWIGLAGLATAGAAAGAGTALRRRGAFGGQR